MTIGSIVHNLFQIVLRRRLTTREQIKAVSDEMLSDSEVAYALYSSSMSKTEACIEFDCFLDKIYEFMQCYVVGNGPTNSANDKVRLRFFLLILVCFVQIFNHHYYLGVQFQTEQFQGQIESIQDIEENVWVPRLGLKGKIDATVMVKCKNQKQTLSSRLMPLELKTGRSSFSPEHTGQLIIYQMMMSDIQQQQQQQQTSETEPMIDSGLLLYLRDGVMREIQGSHRERRDLLLLRNEISYYLAKQFESYVTIGQRSRFNDENYGNASSSTTKEDDLHTELMRIAHVPELPEPIHRANVCATCTYNVLCSVYLNQDAKTMSKLDAKHPLREISTSVTVHLTDAHIDYFCHWVGLMALEDQENRKSEYFY